MKKLQDYSSKICINEYEITDKDFGVLPESFFRYFQQLLQYFILCIIIGHVHFTVDKMYAP